MLNWSSPSLNCASVILLGFFLPLPSPLVVLFQLPEATTPRSPSDSGKSSIFCFLAPFKDLPILIQLNATRLNLNHATGMNNATQKVFFSKILLRNVFCVFVEQKSKLSERMHVL